MKYINKTQPISNVGKTFLETWKTRNRTWIDRLCRDNKTKELWQKFSIKKEIRTYLYQEQEGYCCYCGIGLTQNTHQSVIEHFKTKASDPCENMFDYENMLLSCHGNAYEFYEVREEDTWRSIVAYSSKSEVWLKEMNPDIEQNDNEPKEGEEVIIGTIKGRSNHHCDNFRGKLDLPISPTIQLDCIDKIVYTVKIMGKEGRVSADSDADAQLMIDNLNLNAPVLIQRRQTIVKDARSILAEIAEGDSKDLQTNLILRLQAIDSFYVVYRAFFKDDFPELF